MKDPLSTETKLWGTFELRKAARIAVHGWQQKRMPYNARSGLLPNRLRKVTAQRIAIVALLREPLP